MLLGISLGSAGNIFITTKLEQIQNQSVINYYLVIIELFFLPNLPYTIGIFLKPTQNCLSQLVRLYTSFCQQSLQL